GFDPDLGQRPATQLMSRPIRTAATRPNYKRAFSPHTVRPVAAFLSSITKIWPADHRDAFQTRSSAMARGRFVRMRPPCSSHAPHRHTQKSTFQELRLDLRFVPKIL